ncbi:DEAD/DEAH box helicase [Enterobacter ludwigii]
MTPVQAAALPAILEGSDVRVQAKTGSGKTAAFGLQARNGSLHR